MSVLEIWAIAQLIEKVKCSTDGKWKGYITLFSCLLFYAVRVNCF